jgi:hypothetical protein
MGAGKVGDASWEEETVSHPALYIFKVKVLRESSDDFVDD